MASASPRSVVSSRTVVMVTAFGQETPNGIVLSRLHWPLSTPRTFPHGRGPPFDGPSDRTKIHARERNSRVEVPSEDGERPNSNHLLRATIQKAITAHLRRDNPVPTVAP